MSILYPQADGIRNLNDATLISENLLVTRLVTRNGFEILKIFNESPIFRGFYCQTTENKEQTQTFHIWKEAIYRKIQRR